MSTPGYPPGSAEYVQFLLKTCSHSPKLEPSRESRVPFHLGFFFHDIDKAKEMTRNYTYYGGGPKDETQWYSRANQASLDSAFEPVFNLDTARLCKDCYKLAVPDGFDTWSMPYNLENGAAQGPEFNRYGYLPLQLVPGPDNTLVPH
ncbi:hypothetical protein BCR34DRAFT_571913 [Clohesyomyces aquaticus]|uniref:Uncharacterized protein n=1 Tax=Clohesyomyces aquaticus TaxID=1231657 RepID=A0A1Y1Z5Q0_9PLEO|nr:hypothetical protein BCR34DRAFT_571913 [Clohesyomyces aquaticus]